MKVEVFRDRLEQICDAANQEGYWSNSFVRSSRAVTYKLRKMQLIHNLITDMQQEKANDQT